MQLFYRLSHNHGQQGHPDIDPVSHLPEIGSSWIIIHRRTDLIDPGKGMENDDLLLELLSESPHQ